MKNEAQRECTYSEPWQSGDEQTSAEGDGRGDLPGVRTAADEVGARSATPVEIVHDLNNALVSIVLNAQVVEWKLPSYSRLRRNLHEIERSAQWSGALVKRLQQWLDGAAAAPVQDADIDCAAALGADGETVCESEPHFRATLL